MVADIRDNKTNVDEKTTRPAKNFMRPRSRDDRREVSEFEERVIEVSRVARTVKGGRRIRFRALVVIGNRKGKVAMGVAKANDVAEAVKKAIAHAKKKIVIVPIIEGTIPYELTYKLGSAVVMLRPAAAGTSIVAGGSVRAVAELAGITDLLSKIQGSSNKINNVTATIEALGSFKPEYIERVKKMTESKAKSSLPTPAPVVEEKVEPAVEVEKKPKKAVAAIKKDAKKSLKK